MARVLMFSGGLDSYIMKRMFEFSNEECVFVKMGTKENEIEEELIDVQFPGVQKMDFMLAGFELPNKIIPFRNHILTFLGAQLGTEIYFAFTAGDTTRDKDYVFKAQMEGALNYFIGVPDKSPFAGDEHYRLEMPFKEHTKTELVRMYLDKGFKSEDLFLKSTSCYSGYEIPCGECRSCLRKFVALTINEIDCSGQFLSNPKSRMKEFLRESRKKDRKTELKEIEKCIHILKR